MIKNKDQVRHFYYRTWHKISKYLHIGDDVKKQTQELYGLINYAELRKKIGGCLNEKNRQRLNDLILNGVTFVKFKGKKLRIKTPVCRALKRINNVEEPKIQEEPKLPKEIYVEFRPCTNAAWLHVQSLAQNPRVRTKVNLQRRLSTVIEYLEKKWKPQRLKQKEQILCNLSKVSVPELPVDPPPILRVRPRSDFNISLLSIHPVDMASSADVSLESYKKNSEKNIKEKENIKGKRGTGKVKGKPVMEAKAGSSVSSDMKGRHLDISLDRKTPRLPTSDQTNTCNNQSTVQNTEKPTSNSSSVSPKESSSLATHFKELFSDTETLQASKDSSGEITYDRCDNLDNPVEEAQRSLSLLTNILQSMDDVEQSIASRSELSASNDALSTNTGMSTKEPSCLQSVVVSTKDTIGELLPDKSGVNNMTLGQLLGLTAKTNHEAVDEVSTKPEVNTKSVVSTIVTTQSNDTQSLDALSSDRTELPTQSESNNMTFGQLLGLAAEQKQEAAKDVLAKPEIKSNPETEKFTISTVVTTQTNDMQSTRASSNDNIELPTQTESSNMTLGQLLGLAAEQNCETTGELLKQESHGKLELEEPAITNIETKNSFDKKKDHWNTAGSEKVVKQNKAELQLEKANMIDIEILRKGWTVDEVRTLTVGELYLMLNQPSKIVLEYDWEERNVAIDQLETTKNEEPHVHQLSKVLNKLVQLASITFGNVKNKQQQLPLSPHLQDNASSKLAGTSSSSSQARGSGSSSSKNSSRSPSVRNNGRICGQSPTVKSTTRQLKKEKTSVIQGVSQSTVTTVTLGTVGQALTPNPVADVSSISTTLGGIPATVQDKHMFVVPVGAAPRAVKPGMPTTTDSVTEQLHKLLPNSRRGARPRRKPIVIQRPLLPRRHTLGVGKPMTFVELLPSHSPLTAVIPVTTTSSPPAGVRHVTLPLTKKVVKVVPAAAGPVDVTSLQVPLLKTAENSSSAGVIMQPHVILANSTASTTSLLSMPTVTQVISSVPNSPGYSRGTTSHHAIRTSEAGEGASVITKHEDVVKGRLFSVTTPLTVRTDSHTTLTSLSLRNSPISLKSPGLSSISAHSPPQLSIPETSTSSTTVSISPPNISSLLEFSLPDMSTAVSGESLSNNVDTHLLDFGENSNSSLSAALGLESDKLHGVSGTSTYVLPTDHMVVPKHTTPPQSPPTSQFKISSPGPEGHWLNGESSDFSLSSLLNSLDTPCKSASETVGLSSDSVGLDPLGRLASDVDSHLQCLMNENSLDYVAKFADLAAQISASSESKSS
ncbi:cramped chromatin regulator [Tachypleus tridentatus]|uniref:cramped chromatin regulator n=1 Tax=Tachypleus tridentatus TaxID=6853 RepID=UPI003FD1B78A